MKPAYVALLTGAGVATAIVGVFVWRKKSEIEGTLANVEAAASGDALARTALARQAAQLREDIERVARERVELVANREAEAYIGTAFGLTPERIASIGRLANTLGV
jgi:hypothetical protein